jgi:hypothetical protein
MRVTEGESVVSCRKEPRKTDMVTKDRDKGEADGFNEADLDEAAQTLLHLSIRKRERPIKAKARLIAWQ